MGSTVQSDPAGAVRLSRRQLLRAAAGGAATTLAVSLLAACGSNAVGVSSPVGASKTTSSAKAVQLPAYIPIQGPKPDVPGTAAGIDPAFKTFPKELFKAVKEPPSKGGEVSIMVWDITTPMSPLGQNPAWQEINKQAGANIKLTIVPFADYNTRLAAVVAGNDLPDALFIPPGNANLQAFGEFLKAKCEDLTPYLSGDNIKAYPNLAGFRTNTWKVTLYNNGIFGVPSQYPIFFWVMWVHKELFDAVSPTWPTSADDFKKMMQEVTKPSADVYGIVTETGTGFNVYTGMFPAMFGAPNQWQVEPGGKLTRTIETEQYKAAVGFARDLYKLGVFTPNSSTNNNVQSKAQFAQRKAAVRWDGFTAAGAQFWNTAPTLKPPSNIRTVPPFAADGKSKPLYWFGSGTFGMTVLKKASPQRIKQLLGIINFIASPFGSEENLLISYGIKGVDYNLNAKGNPILTSKGQSDVNPLLWTSGKNPVPVLFNPNFEQFGPTMQADERAMFPAGTYDPTIPFYSPTNGTKAGTLNQALVDGLDGIVAGRRPLTDFDQLVSAWRKNGGDQIRAEYQQALQASGSA